MLIKSEKSIGVMLITEEATVFVLLNGDRANSYRNRLSMDVSGVSRFYLMSGYQGACSKIVRVAPGIDNEDIVI